MPGCGDSFDCLLLPADRVCRQIDPVAGCAPACLEMVLDWEQPSKRGQYGARQGALSAQCESAGLEEPEWCGHGWRTSPAVVCAVLNAHSAHALPSGYRPHQYHVVHGPSRDGPMQEVLQWLRGIRLSKERLALPSLVLTRHGAHWMLAVGARMDADGLRWLALADPSSGRLLGMTAAGVATEFSANLVGNHPDWYGRHVAVVPSVLRRRRRRVIEQPWSAPGAGSHGPGADAGVTLPSLAVGADGSRAAWSSEAAGPVVAELTRLARDADDPVVSAWLAPLRRARLLVPASPVRPGCVGDETHRLGVIDDAGLAIAEVSVRGVPATLMQFWIRPPTV